jgi:hypothetical protein
MHRITWPQMGPFIRREVGAMLDAATMFADGTSLRLQEFPVSYGVGAALEWTACLAA